MILIETCPKCGADLQDSVVCTYPPIYRKECTRCHWSWESRPEEIKRVPFHPPTEDPVFIHHVDTSSIIDDSLSSAFSADPCKNCGSNPANGGSGNCNCTLGQPQIT